MNSLERVTAVVLCWNDAPRVVQLLEGLSRQTARPDRVVVVDNGSRGGAPRFAPLAALNVDVLALPNNVGFAAAANHGIERAMQLGAGWVWLLNSDLQLPPHALASLRNAARGTSRGGTDRGGTDRGGMDRCGMDRCGMVGAVLLESNGELQAHGGGRVDLAKGLARHTTNPTEVPDYLSGACLLLKVEMLRDIGLFDEGYFFYWEDVDLGYRAAQGGWRLSVAHDCRVVHEEAASLGRWSAARWEHLFRGMVRFVRAHAPRPAVAVAARLVHHSAVMLWHGRLGPVRGAWRGAAREWLGVPVRSLW